jgi:hypothetical protein
MATGYVLENDDICSFSNAFFHIKSYFATAHVFSYINVLTLALVENGDEIELDVPNRSLTLHVSEEVLAERRAKWVNPNQLPDRGWSRLYVQHVQQAHLGADFDFLVGGSGSGIPRHSH